ncbi:hypothetical protein QQF64_031188 [Cirrhinus molitorella]|uniref:Transmembrane protein n=1 Tax=Cirrhinus molitorella TaxID=172907 RepID=A0ABR3N5T1_9TELE
MPDMLQAPSNGKRGRPNPLTQTDQSRHTTNPVYVYLGKHSYLPKHNTYHLHTLLRRTARTTYVQQRGAVSHMGDTPLLSNQTVPSCPFVFSVLSLYVFPSPLAFQFFLCVFFSPLLFSFSHFTSQSRVLKMGLTPYAKLL